MRAEARRAGRATASPLDARSRAGLQTRLSFDVPPRTLPRIEERGSCSLRVEPAQAARCRNAPCTGQLNFAPLPDAAYDRFRSGGGARIDLDAFTAFEVAGWDANASVCAGFLGQVSVAVPRRVVRRGGRHFRTRGTTSSVIGFEASGEDRYLGLLRRDPSRIRASREDRRSPFRHDRAQFRPHHRRGHRFDG